MCVEVAKKALFLVIITNIFNCQAYLFNTISVYESSMSLSSYSIGQFPNIALKIRKQNVLPHWCVRWRRNRKFYPIDVCDEGETESFTPLVCAMEEKQKVLPHWCVRWRRNRKFYRIGECDGEETESFTPLVCAMKEKQKDLPHWCV